MIAEIKLENTACVVVENNGKLLLVKRANEPFSGYWAVPGGHSENGEISSKTAKRESMEEIGQVDIDPEPFHIFIHDWFADKHTPKTHQHKCHAFRARIGGEIRAGSDAAEIGWFSKEEVQSLNLTVYTQLILEKMGWGNFNNRRKNSVTVRL
ncbi:MAG: NUDIX domain-containing protein [Candidatus Aenigmarchaeota archaeon]|nr:NUDIX domain-containing protein [Candidatus Aenigmarchaeota archaeon]